MPIEVPIDIDDFQDDEPFTLVNKSELSVEQKLTVLRNGRERKVFTV